MKQRKTEQVPTTYAGAGVNIGRAMSALERIKDHCGRTQDEHVVAGIGPFAAEVDLQAIAASMGMNKWTQAASIDGPGTSPLVVEKMRNATNGDCAGYFALGRTVARHCFSDLACGNARPYEVLDNIDSTEMDPDVIEAIVSGMASACLEHNPAVRLVGGELAQLPGLIVPGQTSFCAVVLGLVDKRERLYPKQSIKPGQFLVGLSSLGIHLNGWSLLRKIGFDLQELGVLDLVPGTSSSIADQILLGQPDYNLIMHRVLRFQDNGFMKHVVAMSHITGGSLYDNILRNLPDGCRVVIDPTSWTVPPLFRQLIELGNVPLHEAYRAWNMGIGFVLTVDDKEIAKLIAAQIRRLFGLGARLIGRVVKGEKGVHITGVE